MASIFVTVYVGGQNVDFEIINFNFQNGYFDCKIVGQVNINRVPCSFGGDWDDLDTLETDVPAAIQAAWDSK